MFGHSVVLRRESQERCFGKSVSGYVREGTLTPRLRWFIERDQINASTLRLRAAIAINLVTEPASLAFFANVV